MTRMGPNDASGVVWAISEFFYISFVFLTNILDMYSRITQQGGRRRREMAIGEVFYISFLFLYILTNIL